jgi:two-component system, OmpR family, sensor histidine kinase QseC
MNSLRARLLVIIGGSLLVLWGVVAAWMLAGLRTEVRTALDERLAASARMVAGLATQFAVPDRVGGPPAGLTDVVARDGLACEVSLLRGELSLQKVARTGASPPMDDAAPGYGTRLYGGKLWRTYVLQQGAIRVATADRLDLREALLRDVALTAAVPFGVALAGSLLMLWVGAGRGLQPLERMRRLLETRNPDDDAPLPRMRLPRELKPLVDTITHLLERVRNAMVRERRFTDDAAHELRTPLTGVKTHLQVLRLALRSGVPGRDVAEALDHADAGVQRMERTLEQLLVLARLDGDVPAPSAERCDADRCVMQAVREAKQAHPGGVDIRVDAAGVPATIAIPEALLVSALRNLLDNALRIAPPGSSVRLEVLAATDTIRFAVLDEGPGMTQAQCALATQRFWRATKTGGGSGLGLAITRSIAERHRGSLRLEPRVPAGLRAELVFPRAGPATD